MFEISDALCTKGETNSTLVSSFFLQLLERAVLQAEQGPT